MGSCEEQAERISATARARRLTIATAESLTGGRISTVLGAAPSSSEWYRGSIVAYASSVKHGLLQVPDGPVVSESSARAMATTVAELLGADLAVAVTGVGGPGPQDGQPPGTVWFGVLSGGAARTELRHFDGEPGEVVEATTAHALFLLDDALHRESQARPTDLGPASVRRA
ncbi:CinA family protein [Rhodococcus sp. T2V]|uniref:CinA family protein n=1 Tax=Rhodococcus sp. T2V TaxID=3034164 RepID=UPI0023E0D8FB|nr:CinA family protein [Rhodococcus sp. T2V]MDF3312601.1 CinA family protein [Rhodococcus sp. T2V]